MKIGLITAPSALAEDIDLFDIYNIEQTFTCENFTEQVTQAKETCEHSLIWIKGIGLYPLKYQTIPMQSSEDQSIQLTLTEVRSATCQNFPYIDLELVEFVCFGELENELIT